MSSDKATPQPDAGVEAGAESGAKAASLSAEQKSAEQKDKQERTAQDKARELAVRIGQPVTDMALLAQALTHPSCVYGDGTQYPHYQRLEFLGDAIVGAYTATRLFRQFPDLDEGGMSKLKARLVSRKTLAAVAREQGLWSFVHVGNQAWTDRSAGAANILSDVVESVVGAVYVDRGYDAAVQVLDLWLGPKIAEADPEKQRTDYKGQLQEATQATQRARPIYAVVETTGPDHKRWFTVEVTLPDGGTFRGEGGSKKDAEQSAAKVALAE